MTGKADVENNFINGDNSGSGNGSSLNGNGNATVTNNLIWGDNRAA